MTDKVLTVDIVTPEKAIVSEEKATLVSAPATLGRVGILPGHMPLVSTLEKGELHLVEQNGKEIHMQIGPGFIQVRDNQVIVLVEEAKRQDAP